jgi:hypothetical protein
MSSSGPPTRNRPNQQDHDPTLQPALTDPTPWHCNLRFLSSKTKSSLPSEPSLIHRNPISLKPVGRWTRDQKLWKNRRSIGNSACAATHSPRYRPNTFLHLRISATAQQNIWGRRSAELTTLGIIYRNRSCVTSAVRLTPTQQHPTHPIDPPIQSRRLMYTPYHDPTTLFQLPGSLCCSAVPRPPAARGAQPANLLPTQACCACASHLSLKLHHGRCDPADANADAD